MNNQYKVILIDSREKLSQLDLLKEDALENKHTHTYVIGFDAEFISKANHNQSFNRSKNWLLDTPTNEAVCVIQLASENYSFLIHLPKIGLPLPSKLKKIIMSDKWLKSGVGIEGDLRKICDNYRLPYYSGSFELKTLAEVGKIRKPNLVNLYSLFVGQQHFKDKSQSICDWSLPLVEKKKIEYAARDAIMSYQVFKYMMTPSLNLIKSKTDTILDLDLDKTQSTYPNLTIDIGSGNDDVELSGNILQDQDIEKITHLLFKMKVRTPDLSHIPQSNNKTQYSKLRKTARSALKRCNKSENITMNQFRLTLINACQIQGYSYKICDRLSRKLASQLENIYMFDRTVLRHIKNLYNKRPHCILNT